MKKQILTALAAAVMIYAATPALAQDRAARHFNQQRKVQPIVALICSVTDCRSVYRGQDASRQRQNQHYDRPGRHRFGHGYNRDWRKHGTWRRRQAAKAYRQHRRWRRRYDSRG